MAHRFFCVALGHLVTVPGILAAAENIPGHDNLARKVVAPADDCIDVIAARRAALQQHVWNESSVGGAECLFGGLPVGLRCQQRGVPLQRDGQSIILRSRKASQRCGKAEVERLDANDFAKF